MGASETASLLISAASGLIGAGIGGVVTYFTVRQQLQHTSDEARLAREHALKREVYLGAAEGMAKNVQCLISIADINLTLRQVQEIPKADPGWAYRVSVIANLDTIKALDEASEFLFSRVLDLMAKRLHLDSLRSTAEAVRERINQVSGYTQQVVAALEAVSVPDATLEARALVPQMTRDLLAAHGQLAALAGEHSQASRREQRAHRDLLEAGMKAAAEHQRFLARANVHIRRELGLPLDAEDYLAHVQRSSDRVLARLTEAMDQFEGE